MQQHGHSVLDFCASAVLLEKFRESREQLEAIQRGLAVFLQSKRLLFPRFYFLADDELLQVRLGSLHLLCPARM